MRLPLHRKLLTATILTVIGAIAVWYFLIFPLKAENDEELAAQQRTAQELRQKGYPTDPDKLRGIRRDLQQQQNRLQGQLGNVYDKAMGQYGERLMVYDTVLGFRRGIGQLDYQVTFNRIRRALDEQDIYLHETILGLSEDSTAAKTYQLVAHMWTVHDLAMLSKRHNLNVKDHGYTFTDEERSAMEGRPRPPARITVEAVRTYKLEDKGGGYLEEFPIQMTVDGSLQDVTAFLTDLTRDTHFLPLEHIALRKIGAEDPRSDRVEATLVCSSFLILAERHRFQPDVKAESPHNVPPPRSGI